MGILFSRKSLTNLSRYSNLSEKTYRRQYSQSFAFVEFNHHTIGEAIAADADSIAAMDCSFIPKSGKKTYGLDWFYNGSTSRSEKGLEISVIAVVVDVAAHRGSGRGTAVSELAAANDADVDQHKKHYVWNGT